VNSLGSLMGIRLIESPLLSDRPKLKLSDKVNVTPEFRAEYDAWLLERFGVQEPVVYMMSGPFGDFFAGGPRAIEAMKRAVRIVT
jgi:hypothetical protein